MTLRARLALVLVLAALPLTGGIAWVRADLERRATEDALRAFIFARMESGGREAAEASPETFPDPPRPRRFEGGPPPPPPRGPRRPEGAPPPPEGRRGPFEGPPPYDAAPPWPPPREELPPPRGPGPGAGFGPGPLRVAGGAAGPGPGPRIELWAYSADFLSANPRAPAFPPALRAALEGGREWAGAAFEGRDGPGVVVAARMAWSEGPAAVVLARRPVPPDAASPLPRPSELALAAGLLGAVLVAAGPLVRRIRRLEVEVRRAARERYATPVGAEGSDEIAALARAFNEAGAEVRAHVLALEERERALREFVANTTHDVATPLTVLQGHLVALRKALEAGAPPERARVLEALEEADYMASLLHNLGAAAKLEAGAPSLVMGEVALDRILERAVARHRPIAAQRGVSIEVAVPEEGLTVRGDEVLLEQAASNLLHNAVRYNRAGGHVAAVLDRRPGGSFSLRVADDGPGVADADLARLGERSFRADAARTRQPDGHGIGLSIARDVARRHGFTLAFRRAEIGGLEAEIAGPAA